MDFSDYESTRLCWLLERFPTYQLRSKPEPTKDNFFWVFSVNDEEGSQNNSYSSSDDVRTRMTIHHDMVISAFSKVESLYDYMFQLWAPVTIGGRQLLSTYRQPFAVKRLSNTDSQNHRLRCEKYGYNINVNNEYVIDDNEHNCWRPEIKSSGPLLSAFLNGLPEMHLEEGEWTISMLIPIFDPSRSSSSSSDCIGVVEFFTMRYLNIQLVSEMNKALEEAGLRAFNVRDRIPYESISGLKDTREEIQKALETVCESHNILVAQAWISYEDLTQMKQKLTLKLTGYISSSEQFSDWISPQEYYDTCDMIPLTMRDELVLKTFQDCEPRFCKAYYSELDNVILLTWYKYEEVDCSGLTICMRSIDTSDFDYAFEFIWSHDPKHVILLEGLLLTLKRCLPHFKFATGAELGDELDVIDVDNSTESETKRFKIFQENRLLPTPKAMEKGKTAMVVDNRANTEVKCKTAKKSLSLEAIEQQFGNTMTVAAKNLNVCVSTLKRYQKAYGIIEWPRPGSRKRKINDSCDNQSGTNENNYGAIQDPLSINRDENTLTIKAEYAGDMIRFDIPTSEATFDTIKKEIFTRFDITVGTYKLKYRDEDGDLIKLSDKDMGYYMNYLKKLNRKGVRLCVCP